MHMQTELQEIVISDHSPMSNSVYIFVFFCVAPAGPATLISVDRTGSDGKSITAVFTVSLRYVLIDALHML